MEGLHEAVNQEEDLSSFGVWLADSEGRRIMRELLQRHLPLVDFADHLYRHYAGRA